MLKMGDEGEADSDEMARVMEIANQFMEKNAELEQNVENLMQIKALMEEQLAEIQSNQAAEIEAALAAKDEEFQTEKDAFCSQILDLEEKLEKFGEAGKKSSRRSRKPRK